MLIVCLCFYFLLKISVLYTAQNNLEFISLMFHNFCSLFSVGVLFFVLGVFVVVVVSFIIVIDIQWESGSPTLSDVLLPFSQPFLNLQHSFSLLLPLSLSADGLTTYFTEKLKTIKKITSLSFQF